MLKFLIAGTVATLALTGYAIAADLPHPQPVVQNAPLGKMPIGKLPIGKLPIGKLPLGKEPTPAPAPVITKG